MNSLKSIVFCISILLNSQCLFTFYSANKAYAAFDVQGVQLFKDNTVCIIMAGSTTNEGFNLANLQTNSESVQSKVSSSGLFCNTPPFFTGGALLSTNNGITIQAQPTVQGLGRGILISEAAGNSSGVSSSGDPGGFSSLITSLGGLTTSIFEISLPNGCDVIDDDNDVVGASTDLSTINDFSFPTCTSTNGLTVQYNTASNLLTAANGLVPATASSPAKMHFAISAFDSITDANMIDSILIRFDSQDIFCPNSLSGPLTATIIAKNAVDNPTKSETLGTVSLGTAAQAVKISYAKETAVSLKGEASTNEIGTTAVLAGSTATINPIQIEELQNESIPVGGQSSAVLINPPSSSTAENNIVNLWLIPSSTTLFAGVPSTSDVTFSDNSLIVNSAPFIVMNNADDLNASFGTIVISLRKNPEGIAPATVKTTITVKNILSSTLSNGSQDNIVSLALFEPVSGAIVNTPAVLSVNNSSSSTNPQNFSAFAVASTRALAQNAVISGAANETVAAEQIKTDADLSSLTSRNTTLGTPQIISFTKVVSKVSDLDKAKITVSGNSILNSTDIRVDIKGEANSSIPGAKIKIETFLNNESKVFDSTTITSKNDGSFTASLRGDGFGNVTIKLKQLVGKVESGEIKKVVLIGCALPEGQTCGGSSLSCDKTVCGCENPNCTPTIVVVLNYIQTNGGLSKIVSNGGDLLNELINAAKKALSLS